MGGVIVKKAVYQSTMLSWRVHRPDIMPLFARSTRKSPSAAGAGARGCSRQSGLRALECCPSNVGSCAADSLHEAHRVLTRLAPWHRTARSPLISTPSPWLPAPASTTTSAPSPGRMAPPPPSPSRIPTSRVSPPSGRHSVRFQTPVAEKVVSVSWL